MELGIELQIEKSGEESWIGVDNTFCNKDVINSFHYMLR